jgi:hypothetical protein
MIMLEFFMNNLSTMLIGLGTAILLIFAFIGAVKVNKSCCGNCKQCKGCPNAKQCENCSDKSVTECVKAEQEQ